jgi:hypothetical protein
MQVYRRITIKHDHTLGLTWDDADFGDTAQV